MTVQEIEKKLIHGIAAITSREPSAIAADQLFHEMGIDSLGFVEILVFIEKSFNLQLIANDLTKQDFESVRALAAFLARKL